MRSNIYAENITTSAAVAVAVAEALVLDMSTYFSPDGAVDGIQGIARKIVDA